MAELPKDMIFHYYSEDGITIKLDATELIRCRDCHWYEIYKLKKDGTEDRRCKPEFCSLHSRKFPDDYFCADGERRGEEE